MRQQVTAGNGNNLGATLRRALCWLIIAPLFTGVCAHCSERLEAQAKRAAEHALVDMIIEKRGTIRIELLPEIAPKTVSHFLHLAGSKFYDGLLFHRVDAKFV